MKQDNLALFTSGVTIFGIGGTLKKHLKILSVTLLLLAGPGSEALAFSPPTLTNLGSAQVDAVLTDFGANFVFRPLEPASSYGRIWGLSVGVIGSLADSSAIRANIPGTEGLKYTPNAEIYLGAQFPLGIAAEFGFFPSLSVGGFKIHSIGGDLKWTFTDLVKAKSLPVDVALRVMYAGAGLSYAQTISGVADTISYSSSSFGTNLSVSKKFLLLEPYLGLGYLHTSSTLSDTGAITLFQSTVSLTDSFSDTHGGIWFYAGLQFTLLIATFSAEYDDMYGVSAGAIKVAFRF